MGTYSRSNMALALFDNFFQSSAHRAGSSFPFHGGFGLHRDSAFSNLLRDTAGRQQAFTSDLATETEEGTNGAYHSSYSFSSSTITGPDGTSRQFKKEQYNDSRGRSKQVTHKQLGDQTGSKRSAPMGP